MYLPQGTILHNRYVIEGLLGHGGFGITYAAYDQVLGARVAIKEYLPRHLATRGEGKTRVSVFSGEARQHFDYGLKKFMEEAQLLGQFAHHPNVVAARDYFEANGTAYMVMEYAEGVTLKEYLEKKGGRLAFEEARGIMMPVMDALREVHQVGLLHRDISPDNIYITVAAQVKVIDFGAARYFAGEQSKSLSIILKSGYAPEEQYRSSGKQGAWTDVYAVGATFYKLLTGQTPPDALDRMAQDTLEPPSRLGVAIPPAAEQALLKALAVNAGQRFPTIGEFQQALLDGAPMTMGFQPTTRPSPTPDYAPTPTPVSGPGPPQVSGQPAGPPSYYPQVPRRSTNPAAIAAGIVAGMIVIVLLVVLIWRQVDGPSQTSDGIKPPGGGPPLIEGPTKGIPEVTEDLIFRGIDRVGANALKLGAQKGVNDVIRSAFMGLENGIKATNPKDAMASDMAGWINFVVAAVMLDDLQRRGVSQNNPKLPKVPLAKAQKHVRDTRLLVEKERFQWDKVRSTRAYNNAYSIVEKLYKAGTNPLSNDLRRSAEKLAEKIRSAHLAKDINRWLWCYHSSYPNLGQLEKRQLELWKNYDIKEVSYRISNVQRLSDKDARADIVWNIQLYDHRTHDYTLVRQAYQTIFRLSSSGWKIANSKEVGDSEVTLRPHSGALMAMDAFTLIVQGYNAIRQGKYEDAKNLFGLAVKQDHNNPFALNNLAVLKEREGELNDALVFLKDAGFHANKYLDKVTQTCFAGGGSLAVKPIREIAAKSSIAPIIRENIYKLKRKKEALAEGERQKEAEFKEKQRLEEAERQRQAEAKQEELRRKNEEKRREAEKREAEERERQLMAMNVFTPIVQGYNAIRQGNYEAAKNLCARALQQDRDNPFALNNLAVLKEREGDLNGALGDLKTAGIQANNYLYKVAIVCFAGGSSLAVKPERVTGEKSSLAPIIRENINKIERKKAALAEERERQQTAPPSMSHQGAGTVFYVSAKRLPFRACPGFNCPKISNLERNEEVEKMGQAENWFQVLVKRSGQIGWVSSHYLSTSPVAENRASYTPNKPVIPAPKEY